MSNSTQDSQSEIKEAMSELFKLCKEVWKRTEWYGDELPLKDEKPTEDFHPLYTSDYLLEKLPKTIDAGRSFAVDMFLVLDRPKSLKYQYRAFYTAPSYGKRHEVIADTPLKALLKLTIALSEAGELNDQSS